MDKELVIKTVRHGFSFSNLDLSTIKIENCYAFRDWLNKVMHEHPSLFNVERQLPQP